jgi:hypothetical protein
VSALRPDSGAEAEAVVWPELSVAQQLLVSSTRGVLAGTGCLMDVRPGLVRMRRPGRASTRGSISEERFEQQVILLARLRGWRGYHTRKSYGVVMGVSPSDAYGWPDWAFWHPRKGLFMLRELKSQSGVVLPRQKQVIAELAACGVDCKVWRPSDWADIERTFVV